MYNSLGETIKLLEGENSFQFMYNNTSIINACHMKFIRVIFNSVSCMKTTASSLATSEFNINHTLEYMTKF